MTAQDRENYLINLFQKINPEEKITKNFKVKGTTIEKLCEYNAGGFQRVREWAEKRVLKIERQKDTEIFRETFRECFNLLVSRNKVYGNSWKVLSIKTIANLCEMKLNRLRKVEDWSKVEDDLKDVINYIVFALIKLKNKRKLSK